MPPQPTQPRSHVDKLLLELPVIAIGSLELDLVMGHVRLAGQLVQLSSLEFRVLNYMASRAGSVVSSAELLRVVWKCEAGSPMASDQVRSCIKRLRQKVEHDSGRPAFILTAYGSGYLVPLQPEEP